MLVDVARRQALAIEFPQEAADLRSRDVFGRAVAERSHDPPGARPRAAAVLDPWLAQQVAVVLDRRGLRAAHLGDPLQPLGGELADGDLAVGLLMPALRLALELVGEVIHRRVCGEVRGSLVEPALWAAPATLAPCAVSVVLLPCESEPALLQPPRPLAEAVAPLCVPIRAAAGASPDSDDEIALFDVLRAGHKSRIEGVAAGLGIRFL